MLETGVPRWKTQATGNKGGRSDGVGGPAKFKLLIEGPIMAE